MSLFSRDKQRVAVEETRRHTRGAHAPAVLPDIREQSEWDAGRAPGALHAPLSAPVPGAALPKAARGRPLVVICRSGNRSQQAVGLLRARGVEAVDVEGGMRQRAAAGHSVVGPGGDEGSAA
ncbi:MULTISPECIES: rhodanese-like domain-containing protein [Streptomyces]|nr:rhodanese-like domain-containing protein [Streptomyces griseus]SEE72284.1 Rhodanese-related sulfurtransferase [Streptomyces griseus]SQA27143.1 Rhodanese domain-containing protein [Streptomyces griseus]